VTTPGTVLRRIAPLAGVLFAGLTIAGDLTIGPFPDGSTPVGDLPASYRAHGAHVSLGGTLMALGGVCFALFAAAVWARLHGARAGARRGRRPPGARGRHDGQPFRTEPSTTCWATAAATPP
jgi:hypothetical protein